MKKDDMEKKVAGNINSLPTEEKSTGRTRKNFSRTGRAKSKRFRTAWWGLRNFALDARCIPI